MGPNPTAKTQPRAVRKRKDIVEAGLTLFLLHGYLGTTMDEVAAGAGTSKQTVYNHFADKENLFAEILTATVAEAGEPVHREVTGLEDSRDGPSDLRENPRRQLRLVMKPRILNLPRLVIGE